MLVLARHGETTWNVEGKRQGWSNEAFLTKNGIKQMEHVAEVLGDLDLDLLICSDLGRVTDSLAVLLNTGHLLGVEISFTSLLREKNFGDLEGKTEGEIKAYWDSYHHPQMLKDKWHQKYPNGESYKDLDARVHDFLFDLTLSEHPSKRIGVLAHEGTNKMIYKRVTGISKEKFYKLKQDNRMVWVL